jgi:hypothetical protein
MATAATEKKEKVKSTGLKTRRYKGDGHGARGVEFRGGLFCGYHFLGEQAVSSV